MQRLQLFFWIWKCKLQFNEIRIFIFNKNYLKNIDEKFKKLSKNTFNFSDYDNVYCLNIHYVNEYIDDWKKFNEATLPKN